MSNNQKVHPGTEDGHISAREFSREQEDTRTRLSKVEAKLDTLANETNERFGDLSTRIDFYIAGNSQQLEQLKNTIEKLVDDYYARQQELNYKEKRERKNAQSIKKELIKAVFNLLVSSFLCYTLGQHNGR